MSAKDGLSEKDPASAAGHRGKPLADDASINILKKLEEFEKTIHQITYAASRTYCAAIISSITAFCDAATRDTSKGPEDCCTPRPVTFPKRPATYRDDEEGGDHWVYHSASMGSGRIGFWINTHDPKTEDGFVSKAIHNNQLWELDIVNLFQRTLLGARRGLVLDVGSNLGYFTLWAAAMGHRVIAFEPMNFNMRRLTSSVVRNHFEGNVTVYQNTVGARGGQLSLQPTNELNKGNFQVQEGALAAVDGLVYGQDYVETVTLDQVVSDDVLLMKIDVEGFESRVLDGARALLCRNVVAAVELEFTTVRRDLDCPPQRALCWLQAIGYRISDLDGGPADAAEGLRPAEYRSYPQNLLLTLRDPFLPPALRLRLAGAAENPCAAYYVPPDYGSEGDAAAAGGASGGGGGGRRGKAAAGRRARLHRARWCGARLAAHSSKMSVCASWGDMPGEDQDVWTALDCDTHLGFNCRLRVLRSETLRRAVMLGIGLDPAKDEDPEWLPGFVERTGFKVDE